MPPHPQPWPPPTCRKGQIDLAYSDRLCIFSHPPNLGRHAPSMRTGGKGISACTWTVHGKEVGNPLQIPSKHLLVIWVGGGGQRANPAPLTVE